MAEEVVGSDVRETDVVGRLTGCRFGVILLHAEFGDAYLIAERIRERLASEPALASVPSGFGSEVFRTVVFPEMASDADTMFRQLGVPGEGDGGDGDEGPGRAPVKARI
jgi:GGDEF domain-containing protein